MKNNFEAKDTVSNKNHDSVSVKGIIDPSTGKVANDLEQSRKSDIENLVSMMQSSLNNSVSGAKFSQKFDLAYQPIYEIRAYAESLSNAVNSILGAYPNMGSGDGSDSDLQYILDICQTLMEGASRVKEYLDSAKSFSNDLDKINSELFTQVQRLF